MVHRQPLIRLERRCPAVADSVGTLRRAARGFAAEHGASERVQRDVALAVSEAATNAIVYGNGSLAVAGDLSLEAVAARGRLAIRVCEHGTGLQVRADRAGRGLGMSIIVRVAEKVELHTNDETCVLMTFPLRRTAS